MPAQIRKLVVQVEDTRIEMGRPVDPPTRKALAMAVIHNPCAGTFVDQLDELTAIGEELGALLGEKCVAALGIDPGHAHSYGKAAIVGEAGELEHAAAILHPKMGAPLRKAVEKGAALVPSAKKRGGMGTAIDVPLATRTRLLCAATSTRWKRASPTRRVPTRSSWRSLSPTAGGPCRASAACRFTRSRAKTDSDEPPSSLRSLPPKGAVPQRPGRAGSVGGSLVKSPTAEMFP
jgi:hypothetical protein